MCDSSSAWPKQPDTVGPERETSRRGKGKRQERVLGSSKGKHTHTQARAGRAGESQGKYLDCIPLFEKKDFLRKQYAQSTCIISTG